MLLRVTFALVAGFSIVTASLAKDAKIGSATLALPSPDGFCELNQQQPSDARVLKIIGDLVTGVGNELLTVSAECSKLEAWRVGKQPALDDYAQYQTPASSKEANLSRAPVVKEFCASMRAEGEKTIAGMTPDLSARMEAAIKGAKFNEMTFLGVLAEDADACYFGLIQKVRTETGIEKIQVTVAATTVVKGKAIFYNLYTVYQDADTATAALARHQRSLAALFAANGE
jgi:hypothetical protein